METTAEQLGFGKPAKKAMSESKTEVGKSGAAKTAARAKTTAPIKGPGFGTSIYVDPNGNILENEDLREEVRFKPLL